MMVVDVVSSELILKSQKHKKTFLVLERFFYVKVLLFNFYKVRNEMLLRHKNGILKPILCY